MVKVTALLTAFNRRESTLKSLGDMFQQQGVGEKFQLDVVLVDDGSSDGTGDAVAEQFPQVNLLRGDGSLFWCGGMCKAYEEADTSDTDFYLLLNDDTYLYADAIEKALATFDEKAADGKKDLVIVGSTCDPTTKEWTYGGYASVSNWHPFRFQPLEPGAEAKQCDTINGNFVLVHRSVVEKVGFLDRRYTHRFGDTDFGMVAVKGGGQVWIAPGYIGECSRNEPGINWDSASYSFLQRVKMFSDVKGMPVRESRIFCQKHGGLLWPVFWLMPIVRGLFFPTRYEPEQVSSPT